MLFFAGQFNVDLFSLKSFCVSLPYRIVLTYITVIMGSISSALPYMSYIMHTAITPIKENHQMSTTPITVTIDTDVLREIERYRDQLPHRHSRSAVTNSNPSDGR